MSDDIDTTWSGFKTFHAFVLSPRSNHDRLVAVKAAIAILTDLRADAEATSESIRRMVPSIGANEIPSDVEASSLASAIGHYTRMVRQLEGLL